MAHSHLPPARALLALALLAILSHSIPAEAKRSKAKYKEITFFLHDRLLIPDPSAFFVVPPLGGLPANLSGLSLFGGVVVMDDLLTVSPDPASKSIGRAKGFYVWDNIDAAQPALELIFTAVFNNASGFPPGSTISYRGFTPIFAPVRESSIVGGTGLFRLARGWSESTVVSFSGVSAIDNFTSFVYYGGY